MKTAALITLSAGLLFASSCSDQDTQDRYSDTHPRISAEVRTSDGETIGTVERMRFETSAQAIIDAYVIEYGGTGDVGGREVLIAADRTDWTGLPVSPVLEIEYTREELEALPDFDEDLATDYPLADDELLTDKDEADAERRRLMETGEGPDAPAESAIPPELAREAAMDDADDEMIEWESTFDPATFAREDWMDREVFTSSGDELGIIVDVEPQDGPPAILIVRTHPDFANQGDTVELDLAQITGVAEQERAVRANYVVVTADPDEIIDN